MPARVQHPLLLSNKSLALIKHEGPPQVWNTNGVEGVYRFLARAWRLFADGVTEAAPQRDQLRLLHLTIKRVRSGNK